MLRQKTIAAFQRWNSVQNSPAFNIIDMNKRVLGFSKIDDVGNEDSVADHKKTNEVEAEFEDCILRYYSPAESMRFADTFYTSTEIQEMINQRGVFVAITHIIKLMRANGFDLFDGEQPMWMMQKK